MSMLEIKNVHKSFFTYTKPRLQAGIFHRPGARKVTSELQVLRGVVLGNEVKGVQQTVVDACDGCIEIPQFGTKHSLNVSVTGGIIIWEFFKKLSVPGNRTI